VVGTPEPASVSTRGRPTKFLPARARATPKPKQPEVSSTASSVRGRGRPRKSAAGPARIAGKQRARVSSVKATEVESAPLQVSTSSTAPQRIVASTSHRRKYNVPGPSQSAAATAAAVLNAAAAGVAIPSHGSQLVAPSLLLRSTTTDAPLSEVVVPPEDLGMSATQGRARQQRQEVSQPQCLTSLSTGENGTTLELGIRKLQSSAAHGLELEEVGDLPKINKIARETLAADLLSIPQTIPTRVTADSLDRQPLRISPLVERLTNFRLSDIEDQGEWSLSLDHPYPTSTICSSVEGDSTLAPTPSALEEGQTPDTATLFECDTDATDATNATISTLVTSRASTPKVKTKRYKSIRRQVPHTGTAESIDDHSSSGFMMKSPAMSSASTPLATDSVVSMQPRPPDASISQSLRRSLRIHVQIPADSASSSRPLSGVLKDTASREPSPVSAAGAATLTLDPEPKARKRRKLGCT
jgi:hypothetical protein